MEKEVGRIKNINVNLETEELEVTIAIFDKKFKKQIIRDLAAAGKIKFEEDRVIFIEEENANV